MYNDLLRVDRIRDSTRGSRGLVEEVESDRARVLYSASFRRLQRKTQVFPLEDNAAVRSRLTHSLEVAHVGRFLASSLAIEIHNRGLTNEFGMKAEVQHALTVTVEVACLLHDIGNPAFGHFGEAAVAQWFGRQTDLPEVLRADMAGFDGNPQGLRIIASLAGHDSRTGMNLTLSQIASTIKYQVLADEHASAASRRYKKFGAFETERRVIDQLRAAFSLKPWQRFPLAYLMEAADDISYCLSDIEDGVEKKIIKYDDFITELSTEVASNSGATAVLDGARAQVERAKEVDPVVSFRSHLVRHFVNFAVSQYIDKHPEILSGALKELIDPSSPEGSLLSAIKAVVRRRVYTDDSIQTLELAGDSVIAGLLNRFGTLLKVDRKSFAKLLEDGSRVKGLDVEKRLLDLVAKSHKRFYLGAVEGVSDDAEMLLRGHLIADYISGMTDPFALRVHQKLAGIHL